MLERPPATRWFCQACSHDWCYNCRPVPGAVVAPNMYQPQPPVMGSAALPFLHGGGPVQSPVVQQVQGPPIHLILHAPLHAAQTIACDACSGSMVHSNAIPGPYASTGGWACNGCAGASALPLGGSAHPKTVSLTGDAGWPAFLASLSRSCGVAAACHGRIS